MNKQWLSRLKQGWQTPDRRAKWISLLGMLGILLIFFSQFSGREKAPPLPPEPDAAAYSAALEQDLTEIISKISGAGKTQVLVTLNNDGETLFVREKSSESDVQSGEAASSERERQEEKYVLVDGKNGRSALIRTRMEPVIRGVVVVCEGGEDPVTAARIMEAVTTALAVSAAKVCITKLA